VSHFIGVSTLEVSTHYLILMGEMRYCYTDTKGPFLHAQLTPQLGMTSSYLRCVHPSITTQQSHSEWLFNDAVSI